MADVNPYVFNTPSEMQKKIDELGLKHDIPDANSIVVEISRTPFESLCWEKEVEYGTPPQKYKPVCFGEDVPTPWGPLPAKIYLVRMDVIKQLRKTPEQIEQDLGLKKRINLFPPGWKPAPGFEDPRKDFR